jgi:two-component system, sensor histidine kinase and response regulator
LFSFTRSLLSPLSHRRPISWSIVESIGTLLQQTAGAKAFVWQRADADRAVTGVISPEFSGLLQAEARSDGRWDWQLSFAPEAIRVWQESLPDHPVAASQPESPLELASHREITSNQASRQTEFTLQLIELLQDQTDQLEAQLIEQSQALGDTLANAQTAHRVKAEFLATMSHELRTPLTCIIGMASTLLRPSAKQLPATKLTSYLSIIHDRGEALLTLINDILDLSKVEASSALERREFSLSQLANQVLKDFQAKADHKQIELKLDLQAVTAEYAHYRFQADPQRVRQILRNLLSNAIKFTQANGTVTLQVWVGNTGAILQVKDTGIGIAQHQQHLLFQKFQQLDSSYHRRYEGTGLGLALTKQLVELHGGTITMASTLQVGSVFTVKFPPLPVRPVASGPARQAPPMVASSPFHSRILLFEPHEETANLVCDLLTAADYQVIWVTDAETGLKQFTMQQAKLAIVNFSLPDMTCDSLVQRLHQQSEGPGFKVLALLPEADQAPQAMAAGVDDYLAQPLNDPERLIDKVMVLIAQAESAARTPSAML